MAKMEMVEANTMNSMSKSGAQSHMKMMGPNMMGNKKSAKPMLSKRKMRSKRR